MKLSYLFFAIIFLLLGHLFRILRWNIILCDNKSSNSVRFFSLSLGYIINFLLPFKLGEIVRGVVYSKLSKTSMVNAVSSIIIERVSDLFIWLLGLLIYKGFYNSRDMNEFSNSIILLAIVVLFFSISIYNKKSRIAINRIFGIFNSNISFFLRHFTWTMGENVKQIYFKKCKFLLNTLIMWGCYFVSYSALCHSINMSLEKFITSIFSSFFSSTSFLIYTTYAFPSAFAISIYFMSPLIIVCSYFLIKFKFNFKLSRLINLSVSSNNVENIHKHFQFTDKKQYSDFLRSFFSEDISIVSLFYKFGTDSNTKLHKIFHGGSDALTTLIEYDKCLYVRKFATIRGKEKLKLQYDWLSNYNNDLPLCSIGLEVEDNNYYIYDMPFDLLSIDFYEFIHTAKSDVSWECLHNVLENIDRFHYKFLGNNAEEEDIERYISDKLINNFNIIIDQAPEIFKNQNVVINSKNVNLTRIRHFINNQITHNSFRYKKRSIIHGDLTIENIIINKSAEFGWFIIDPNVGNIFESPLLDYAKLMQSLHLGYELLNRSIQFNIDQENISVGIYKTDRYSKLYHLYKDWLLSKYGESYLREVMLHEIIHYMRLVPYKFRKSRQLGLAFTSCMLLIVDEYLSGEIDD